MNKKMVDRMIMIKKVQWYVEERGWTIPTDKEIKRSVPPGRQDDARKQELGNRLWIGRDSVYGGKMWYSEADVERMILMRELNNEIIINNELKKGI